MKGDDALPTDPLEGPIPICGLCNREMAASEVMGFNAAAARRAGLDFVCPACADGPSRRRIFGRAPDFYIVSVPDAEGRDRCVESYLRHGWKVASRDEVAVRVKNRRRSVVVEIAIETMSVGESALKALDQKLWSRDRRGTAT